MSITSSVYYNALEGIATMCEKMEWGWMELDKKLKKRGFEVRFFHRQASLMFLACLGSCTGINFDFDAEI